MPLIPCTWSGFLDGAHTTAAVSVSVALVGVTFGVTATSAGLAPAEASWMSVWVYGAAAQFAALDVWGTPLPIAPILLATLAISARGLLYGASIRRYLHGLRPSRLIPALMVLNDANWALTMTRWRDSPVDAGFILGSGLTMFAAWQFGTQAGLWFGATIENPEAYGLDVMIICYFAAMLPGVTGGVRSSPAKTTKAWAIRAGSFGAWAIGGIVAIAVNALSPVPAHVFAGAITGSLAATLFQQLSTPRTNKDPYSQCGSPCERAPR